MQAYHDGHPAHKFGYQPVFCEVLGLDVGKHFVRNFVVGKFYLPAEAEGSCILPLLHYLIEADERTAADEQDIRRIYAQHLLLGVLSAALGRHVGNGAFNNL